jgi:hypothetical protein
MKPWTKIPPSNSFGEKAFIEFPYCNTYEVEMKRQEKGEERQCKEPMQGSCKISCLLCPFEGSLAQSSFLLSS